MNYPRIAEATRLLCRLDDCGHNPPRRFRLAPKPTVNSWGSQREEAPSDAKLGASFALPFADWHSRYSQNVGMSTAGRENPEPARTKLFRGCNSAPPLIGPLETKRLVAGIIRAQGNRFIKELLRDKGIRVLLLRR